MAQRNSTRASGQTEKTSVTCATRPLMADIIAQRISRRQALGGIAASSILSLTTTKPAFGQARSSLNFTEIAHGYDTDFHVPEEHKPQILIRWGDPLFPDAPAFDPLRQTASAQSRQFGYNNDFVAFLPLPHPTGRADHGLLCVNHEFTNANLMFPDIGNDQDRAMLSAEQVNTEMAAHGHSIVEVRQRGGNWETVLDSPFNRRITALETEMNMTGPAAGHARLKTAADPEGRKVIGTLNNCAGGVTPWGTVLIAEENFHAYFAGDPDKTAQAENHKKYGMRGKPRFQWGRFHERFDLEKTPNEPNRFGWIVEVDPYNPRHIPQKHTALGRFKHEGATTAIAPDGRVVVYSGDDERFEYLYRFISDGRYDSEKRSQNMRLLQSGTLSVARFNEDGSLQWLPLVWGEGPLTPENGFASQADILIETRRAADLLGATPMDRPEDVETNPVSGSVFLMLTNNTRRQADATHPANPRARNRHGHILELIPPGGAGRGADHAAATYQWEILLMAGNPDETADGARYHAGISPHGWLSNPDNCAFDHRGRLWIATDGAPKSGFADGLWACDVEGPGRALTRHFLRTPRGAELCGPCFTPDDRSLFVAVQHPGAEAGSDFHNPSTRWPDFSPEMPPRPAIVAVTAGGQPIGNPHIG